MTNDDIYNLVKKNGMATHAACSLLAQTFQQMANLFATVESHQPAEPATSTLPAEVRPPEMATHAPSTVPPRFEDHVHEVGSCICDTWPVVAKTEPTQAFDHVSDTVPFAADDSPDSESEMPCPRDPRCTLGPFHNGACNSPPASEVRPVAYSSQTADSFAAPSPPSGVRKKNEYTAAQWLAVGGLDRYFETLKPSHGLCGLDIASRNRIREAFAKQFGASDVVGARWGARIPAVARSIGFVVDP